MKEGGEGREGGRGGEGGGRILTTAESSFDLPQNFFFGGGLLLGSGGGVRFGHCCRSSRSSEDCVRFLSFLSFLSFFPNSLKPALGEVLGDLRASSTLFFLSFFLAFSGGPAAVGEGCVRV